jgi:DNA topoisomerase-1
MKLLIVESPGKVEKIQGFLGNGWKVSASVGHVRDLPWREIGGNVPDFRPAYAPTDRERSVRARLGKEVKAADAMYLAMAPDRAGEAIAWHLADALRLRDARRVTFDEITEKAAKAAPGQPRRWTEDR